MKKLPIIITSTLIALLGIWALNTFILNSEKKVQRALAGGDFTAPVERRSITRLVEVAGDVDPAEKVEVKAEISAKIKKVHVDVGTMLEKGDILLELDDRDLLTEKEVLMQDITGSKLELDKAERDFQRSEKLFQKGLISEQLYLDARTKRDLTINLYEKSRTRLRLLEDKLAKTVILSPMDGTVLQVPVIEGQVVVGAASVNSGTLLMEIAQLHKMLIMAHVGQVDVARLGKGMDANFTVDSLPEDIMKARVTEISPIATVKRNIKGFTIELTIDEPDPRIRPGMTAMVSIPVDSVEDALSVPLSAVFLDRSTRKKIAYIQKDEKGEFIEKREIEIGLSNIDYVEIKSGLAENDRVLLIRPGKDKVKGG
ncbi:MAG: efflux RND transporter periplasmic adaptor subunit [Verrucomicrobiota bacterium]